MPMMGVCVCAASREGEQMPPGHVISLTLGQSQWKQRNAGRDVHVAKHHIILIPVQKNLIKMSENLQR